MRKSVWGSIKTKILQEINNSNIKMINNIDDIFLFQI